MNFAAIVSCAKNPQLIWLVRLLIITLANPLYSIGLLRLLPSSCVPGLIPGSISMNSGTCEKATGLSLG